MPQEYQIAKVPRSYTARASRYALSTLLQLPLKPTDQQVAEAVQRLVRQRSARINALRGAGWGRAQKPKDLAYLLNCPPAAVVVEPGRRRTCNEVPFCPFCWCREYVEPTFQRVAAAVEHGAAKEVFLDLLEVHSQRLHHSDADPLSSALWWAKQNKGLLLRTHLSEAVGAFVLCSLGPRLSDEDGYMLEHRVLALWPATEETPKIPRSVLEDTLRITRTVRRLPSPSKSAIAAAVGRTCLYPAWLLRGPAHDVCEMLEARAAGIAGLGGPGNSRPGIRMVGRYGVLRQASTGL